MSLTDTVESFQDYVSVVWHRNFVVIREGGFVFILFYRSGYVNVTGVKSHATLPLALSCFATLFGLRSSELDRVAVVDNLTLSGHFGREVDLEALGRAVENGDGGGDVSFSVDCFSYFPGVFVRFRDLGTAICFRSGSYVIIGCRTTCQARDIFSRVTALIGAG